MFDLLSDRFTRLQRKLRGYGSLSSKEVADALREIRVLLLEADVHYKVAGHFIRTVKAAIEKQDVAKALKPGEVINYTLYRELAALLGGKPARLDLSATPAIVALVGLQGTGKTTFAGKLALKHRGRKPLLVACDAKRPAASDQLKRIAEQAGCGFHPVQDDVLATCRSALAQAKKNGNNLILLDTAGRLHIDVELMDELAAIQQLTKPSATLLILDGMVGQDALSQAETFHERLDLTGCCITKLDGDTRGGAVVSVRHVTGLPVYYIGTGEHLPDLEEFHPDRIASRILGRGDMQSLAEKVQAATSPEDQRKTAERFLKGRFDLEDFLNQLRNIRKMGNIQKLLAMIPGAGALDVDENEMTRVEALIQSMTPQERRHPDIIDGSRRRRIADGSGTRVQDVNHLLKDFKQARAMAGQLGAGGKMPQVQRQPRFRGRRR